MLVAGLGPVGLAPPVHSAAESLTPPAVVASVPLANSTNSTKLWSLPFMNGSSSKAAEWDGAASCNDGSGITESKVYGGDGDDTIHIAFAVGEVTLTDTTLFRHTKSVSGCMVGEDSTDVTELTSCTDAAGAMDVACGNCQYSFDGNERSSASDLCVDVSGGGGFSMDIHMPASGAGMLRTEQQVYHMDSCAVSHSVDVRESTSDDWTRLLCLDLTNWDGNQDSLPSQAAVAL